MVLNTYIHCTLQGFNCTQPLAIAYENCDHHVKKKTNSWIYLSTYNNIILYYYYLFFQSYTVWNKDRVWLFLDYTCFLEYFILFLFLFYLLFEYCVHWFSKIIFYVPFFLVGPFLNAFHFQHGMKWCIWWDIFFE
jgi:hypothetical protein